MIFTDNTWKYFSLIPFKVRAVMAKAYVPFDYDDEPFFASYDALHRTWVKRQSQRMVADDLGISRDTLKRWEQQFVDHGTIGLLPELSYVDVDIRLEKLTILIKSCRPHESASLALKLADALEIPGATLELIRQIQRCYGYGHRLDGNDIEYFSGLQHILSSITHHTKKKSLVHDKKKRAKSFYDFDHDPMQQRIELFKTLSEITKKRQIRLVLKRFGIHPNRYGCKSFLLKAMQPSSANYHEKEYFHTE